MKISAKLLILVLALFIVSASIIVFLKTMSIPPTHMEEIDEFSEAIKRDIDTISDTSSQEELDSLYMWIHQELNKWSGNRYLDDTQHDDLMRTFYQKYVPTFVTVMKKKLSHEVWGDKEKAYITNQIASAESVRLKRLNKKVIEDDASLMDKFSELTKICSDYDKAKKLISSSTYIDINDARNRINLVKDYSKDTYVNHSDISSKLMSFPNDIGNSHYDQIYSYYSRIENWNHYTLSQTKDNYSKFEKLVDDYTGTDIYGNTHPKSLNNIMNQAKQYMNYAYDNKCVLKVNGETGSYTTSSWSSSSGTYTYNIETDHPDGYSLSNLPSWLSIKERNEKRLSVSYNESYSSYSREGFFYVNAGNKSVRINCSQNPHYIKAEASITSVSTNHNVWNNGKKGMRINVSFNASGLRGESLYVNLYFYFSNGKALKDFNNSYRTTGGDVATHKIYTPSSDNVSTTVSIFMPYDELHMEKGQYKLKFSSIIMHNSKTLDSSSYYNFDFNQN